MQYVIIGNGVAGVKAALTLRSFDPGCSIHVISRETEFFYSRTALMYIAMRDMRLEDTEPYEQVAYRNLNIEHSLGVVEHIAIDDKQVLLEDGHRIAYDKLLLATGAVPAMHGWPGSDLKGVATFISFQDMLEVCGLLRQAKKGVVVGAGLIGVELAEVFRHYGLDVHFLMRGEHFWPRELSPEEGTLVMSHLRTKGVVIETGAELERIDGEQGRVQAAVTSDGRRFSCQAVGIAAGVVPNTTMSEASGIPCGKGILTNWNLETRIPDIYAAGDCVEIETEQGANFVRTIWYSARDMGVVAAQNMTGRETLYQPGSWYNSAKFFDLEYTAAGQNHAVREGEQDTMLYDKKRTLSVRITHNRAQVLGFSMVGGRWDHQRLLQFIAEGCTMDQFIERRRQAWFAPEFMPVPKLHIA